MNATSLTLARSRFFMSESDLRRVGGERARGGGGGRGGAATHCADETSAVVCGGAVVATRCVVGRWAIRVAMVTVARRKEARVSNCV